MEHAAAQGWPVLKHNEFLTSWSEAWFREGERHEITQAPKFQMQLYFDVILILADVISCSSLTRSAILDIKMLYNTILHNHKDKVKKSYSIYTSLSNLHKYTKLLFFGFFFFKKKAVGFLGGEKLKYYVFVKRSDSPLCILLMCQNVVSLVWRGYLEIFREQWLTAHHTHRNLYLTSWMVKFGKL